MPLGPGLYLRALVGRIAVGYQVRIEALRCLAADLFQEAQPLDVVFTGFRTSVDIFELVSGGDARLHH